MSYDDLNMFRHVATHGSFSKASEILRRPKSSVSAAVSRLEAHLGVRLFERTTRRIRLTEAGTHLHADCSEHMEALGELMLATRSEGREISGTLRLASPYEFGAHHLAFTAAKLMAKYQGLRIVLDVTYGQVDLFDTNYDIVFSMPNRELPNSTIVMKRVFELQRGIFSSPSLLQKHGEPTTPAELAQIPLLCGPDEKHWLFTDPTHEGEIIEVDVSQTRLISANAGFRKFSGVDGVGALRVTSSFCKDEVSKGQLKQILTNYICQPQKIYALMPARRLTLPRVHLFLDTLVADIKAGAGVN